ncbi:DUF443 domain-containing protein [Staphylococcus pettenkoferi]|nr:DUF443 domain-containing protein [Staphylococcus pettenkoferi]
MARVHLIYKNPRYKVVQKDSKYLLIDLEQHWYSYLFPMLNWIIPIKYIELTYEEYNSLNIIPSNKHYGNSILASGITVIISVFLRKFIILMNIPITPARMIIIFLMGLIFIVYLRIVLSRRLKISKFEMKEKRKLRLFPTLKNLAIVLLGYIYVFPMTFIPCFIIYYDNINILFFICWLFIAFLLTVVNFSTISDRKVYVKLQN